MTATLAATIKGRTFRLAAPDGEARSLADAIAVVEAQCSLIVQKQPGAEIERVLLLAALELAARGFVMDTGRITRAAPSAELRDDPAIREAYLGSF